jgi:hypothetical protein
VVEVEFPGDLPGIDEALLLKDGARTVALVGRLPSEVGYQPTLADEIAALEERIATANGSAITSIQAVYVPAMDLTDPAVAQTFIHLDASIVLSRNHAAQGLYPAIDPLGSTSRVLDPVYLGEKHYEMATPQRTAQVNWMMAMTSGAPIGLIYFGGFVPDRARGRHDLFCRFDPCHTDGFGLRIHLACYADLLTGKLASLVLSSVIQGIDNLMSAISKDKLSAAVNAFERARLIIAHLHRRVIQAAHAVADVTDNGCLCPFAAGLRWASRIRSSVRMLAHQVFHVKRHLPSLIGFCLGTKGGHPALLDPIGDHPVDFAIGDSVDRMAGEVGRLYFHALCDLRFRFAVLAMARCAAPVEECTPCLDVRFSRR